MESAYMRIKTQIQQLYEFAHSHGPIYIYGAGDYGKTCFAYLQKRDVRISGFITTDGGDNGTGIPVYKASEILSRLPEDTGIILAVKQVYLSEIKKSVLFPCDTMDVTREAHTYLRSVGYWEDILFRYKYPFEKKILSTGWSKILLVQLEVTFGDMIWSTAFCRELRRNFPQSRIVMIVNRQLMSLYRNCPYVDQIVPYECDTLLQELSNAMMDKANAFFKDHFQGVAFDAVFLPRLLPSSVRDSWENVLLALASGAEYRIGHAMYVTEHQQYMCDVASELFTAVSRHTEAKHEVLHDLDMLAVCGLPWEDDAMELWLDENDRAYAESVLGDVKDDVLVVAVALVGRDARRAWDPCKYAKVFARMHRKYQDKVLFVLCGGKDASEAAHVVCEGLEESFIDLTGKTSLTEIAAVISKCDLYLGSDTGLMHMASASGVPVIEISAYNMAAPACFGSSPTRTGPWKVESVVLRPEKALDDCVNMCTKSYAHCINQIGERQVEEALEEMLHRIRAIRNG